MPARLIITAAAIGLLVFAGAVAVDAGVHESGDRFDFNESFNAAQGDLVTLDESQRSDVRYYRVGNVEVENESGLLMFEGTDYHWYQSNGTLEVLSSRLANDNATVDYGYVVTGENLGNTSSAAGTSLRAGTMLIWVVVTGFVVTGMRALGAI